MREFGKIMAAFAGGALVGAVVALLTAPKSGAETRAQIIALAKEKGLHLDHTEWDAFVAKVKARLFHPRGVECRGGGSARRGKKSIDSYELKIYN